MVLNRDHHAFDEAMELLCLLPEWPRVSFLADLRDDMGYDSQGDVEEKLKDLRERGFRVQLSSSQMVAPGGRCGRGAWIDSAGSAHAAAAAQAYFEKVYCEPAGE